MNAVKQGKVWKGELLNKKKNGDLFFIFASIYKVLDKQNNFLAYVGFQEDITDRKRVENALRESEGLLRDFMDNANDLILIIKPDDARFVFTNQAFKETLGYNDKEISECTIYDIIHPDSLSHCMEFFQRIITGESFNRFEAKFVAKQGSLIIVECNANCSFQDGKPFIIRCICHDITERKLAEQSLIESEKKYHSLIENMNDIIYSMDEKGIFTYISPQIERFGYKSEEIVSHPFIDFIVFEDKEKTLFDFRKTIETGEEFPSQFKILNKEGGIHWFEEYGKVQRDETGKIVGLTGALRDITERKKMEEKLTYAQKELEIKTKNLEETNTALKVLLKHQDTEKNKMKNNILENIHTLVLPYLEKIKIGTSDEKQTTFVNIIETNLSEITKSFTNQLSQYYSKFTPTEIQIANLIRENKTTKDIAGILNISETTVFFHRRNIRTKLGLRNNKINLRVYLQSIPIK